MVVAPLFDPLDKGLTPEVMFGNALLFQLLFDAVLRRDARVVGARNPHGGLALLPRAACEDVLHRVVQDVPHVQHAGDIGRRDNYGMGFREAFLGRRRIMRRAFPRNDAGSVVSNFRQLPTEGTGFFPNGVPLGFNVVGVVGF